MQIGIVLDDFQLTSFDDFGQKVRAYADAGYSSIWTGQHLNWDVLTLLATIGGGAPGVTFGTAIIPTYPRHPMALAGQALTVQAAIGNRLHLGVGPSHQVLMEGLLGYRYERPARHVRDYLRALRPLLSGEDTDYDGETLQAKGNVGVPGAMPPPLLVSALGPVMLRLAGELADGTITVWAGARTIGDHVAPSITKAAEAAGRPRPRVVAMVSVAVTDDPDATRRLVAERFGIAGGLPAYRAVLDREGVEGPEDTVVAGDEAAVERGLQAIVDAGATELIVVPVGEPEQERRTTAFLGDLARRDAGR